MFEMEEKNRRTSRVLKKKPRDQGKPSKLIAYLILVLLTACFINVYENACFYIAITSR
jgi:hypothetical protein